MTGRTHRFGALGVAAALLAGCGVLDAEPDAAALDLAQARQLWASAGIDDYDLIVERVCFCLYLGPVRVEVRNGRRVATVPVSGPPPETSAIGEYPTVEGLFDVVAEAMERPADELRVTYHPVLGYPVDLWIDPRRAVDDDELGYRVDLVAPTAGG